MRIHRLFLESNRLSKKKEGAVRKQGSSTLFLHSPYCVPGMALISQASRLRESRWKGEECMNEKQRYQIGYNLQKCVLFEYAR